MQRGKHFKQKKKHEQWSYNSFAHLALGETQNLIDAGWKF